MSSRVTKRFWTTLAAFTTVVLLLLTGVHHHRTLLVDALRTEKLAAPDTLRRTHDQLLRSCDVGNLQYLGKDVVLGCKALGPPQPTLLESAETVRWVAAFGDSLTRSPFITFVNLMVGRAWESERRAFSKQTYHSDHIFCCRNLRDRKTCRFQRRGLEYNTTTSEVVQTFLQQDIKSFCYSWVWSPFAEEKLVARTAAALRSDVAPDLLILNPGLHSLMMKQPLADIRIAHAHLFSSVLEATREQPPGPNRTRTLIHEIGFLREMEMSPKKRGPLMSNDNVRQLNAFAADWIDVWRAHEEMAVVPIYRLGEAGDVKPQGDGIHFQGHFQQLVLHLDFYLGLGNRNAKV